MKPIEIKPKWSISFGQNDATIYSEGTIASIDDTMIDWKNNVHLMAAAPDMLKALQRLTHPMADDEDLEFALETIQKAKGEK
jgi:hypothetical protein